jgi:type II secretory pathway predicted ATPase ExeA
MLNDHFGFARKPFANTPDPQFLYLSRRHNEALARLQYAVEERELGLLIGAIGAGKTTLSRALMDACGDDVRFFILTNTRLSPTELLRTLARLLGEAPEYRKADVLDQIQARLVQFHEQGLSPVFILDEAQLIPSKATFDEIRLLTNFQLDDRNLMTILLMGQPELGRRLKHPAYEALMQRVGIRYTLEGLEEDEISAYISHRLTQAGGPADLFKPETAKVFFAYTRGIPRLINTLGTLSLLEAMQHEAKKVTAAIVEKAAREMPYTPKEPH